MASSITFQFQTLQFWFRAIPDLELKAILIPTLELVPTQGDRASADMVFDVMLCIFGITYHASVEYDRHPYSSWEDKANIPTWPFGGSQHGVIGWLHIKTGLFPWYAGP